MATANGITASFLRLGWLPLFNARFVAFVVMAFCLLTAARRLSKARETVVEPELIAIVALAFGAAILMLWGLTQEAYETCYYLRDVLGTHWDRWARMTISLVWSVYGASLLIIGIERNYQPLRLAALGLLCATVGKVFLFDLSFLDASLRMLSLGGLGGALLFISWLYGRYGSPPTKVL